jgi:hypothetical protein
VCADSSDINLGALLMTSNRTFASGLAMSNASVSGAVTVTVMSKDNIGYIGLVGWTVTYIAEAASALAEMASAFISSSGHSSTTSDVLLY